MQNCNRRMWLLVYFPLICFTILFSGCSRTYDDESLFNFASDFIIRFARGDIEFVKRNSTKDAIFRRSDKNFHDFQSDFKAVDLDSMKLLEVIRYDKEDEEGRYATVILYFEDDERLNTEIRITKHGNKLEVSHLYVSDLMFYSVDSGNTWR